MTKINTEYKIFRFTEYLDYANAIDHVYGKLSQWLYHGSHKDDGYYLMIDKSCLDVFRIPDSWMLNEVTK